MTPYLLCVSNWEYKANLMLFHRQEKLIIIAVYSDILPGQLGILMEQLPNRTM